MVIILSFVMFLSFGIYVYFEKQVGDANQLRHLSYKLANRLHQSSDDLTRMARTYVVTSDPRYKKYFHDILDIRDGKKPLPKGYFNIYWDLVLASDQQYDAKGLKSVALLDMMRQSGFTEIEFDKLTKAKIYSDNLVDLELKAMDLVEFAGIDIEANRAKAIMLLHNKSYHQAKATIMEPINEFNDLVETRTLNNMNQSKKYALIFRIIFITITLAIILMLCRFSYLLHITLGSSVNKIHQLIQKIGRNDFSTEINVTQDISNTVLSDLYKMQNKLYTHERERIESEQELRIAAAFFESQEAMMITDSNSIIIRVNKAFTRITGYTSEEVVGQTPRLLQSGRHDKDFYNKMWGIINRTDGWQGEVWDKRKNGEIYPKWLTISVLKDSNGVVTHYIGMHLDISAHKEAEEKVRKLAFFDQLTNLPNRRLFLDRLTQTMLASARSGKYNALLFIDLDDFKTLNDTLGHNMGDLLLEQTAQRLGTCIRKEDTVARLGGDEFVVILNSLGLDKVSAASQTEQIGKKLIMTLNQEYLLGSATYRNTLSIGATLFNGNLVTVENLMKQADLAMYKSKETKCSALHFFDPEMEDAALKHTAFENELRMAIHQEQFLIYYQAQVDGENRIIGAEALIRWKHPKRGLVPPNEFIPLAEQTELIVLIGYWVLKTTCSQLVSWEENPKMSHLIISVNVSAKQFNHYDFVDQVQKILKQTGANPRRLNIELTESIMVSNIEEINQKMYTLKAMGIEFSLDDFGTGYSSLSYLKNMPIDWLKIDRSFVSGVLKYPSAAVIVKIIIMLAKDLDIGIIAEGVETTKQREFLANAGCLTYQGYLSSRPLPLENFEQFVSEYEETIG